MGYFSNGTEGEMYHDQWCSRCAHDMEGDCQVWNAHLCYSYRDCNDPSSILHMLIPRDGEENKRCTMFIESSADRDLFGKPE